MFLGALLASRGSSPSSAPSPPSTRRHRKRTRYDSDDDDSDDDGGSSTRRRRVGAGGAGGGAGAGSSNSSRAGAGAARKVSIPAAGGYDMLKVVPLTKANPSTRGPNLTASDEGSLVTVRTRFAGINYADICVRWGLYESAKKFVGWPITPGFEFSGTVDSVQDDVSKFKVGDRVFGCSLFGGYSTHITVPERQLYRMPSRLTDQQAAAFPAVAMTAWYAFCHLACPKPGRPVLVHSAAGGVGSMLCQIGRIHKCKVVGVVGASHKVAAARSFGCDVVIDKSKEDLWAKAKEAAPDGYAAIFDANGVSTLQGSFDSIAPTGRLVIYGFHSMLPRQGGVLTLKAWAKIVWDYLRTPSISPMAITTTNKSVMGFNLSFLFKETELLDEAMEQLVEWVESGQLTVPKVTEFKLEDVGKAHEAIESGQTVGKLVLNTA